MYGHRCLTALALRIGVSIEIFEVKADQDEYRRVKQASAGAFEALLHDLHALPVHLQVGPPLFAHRARQTLFGRFFGEHGESPGLSSVGGRGPPGGLEYALHEILGHALLEKTPDGATAMNRVEYPGLGGLRLVEGAPRGGSLGAYGDYGVLLYAHRLILVVLTPQEPHGCGLLLGIRIKKLSPATHHHESKEVPVLVVAVDDERYIGILEDVPDALETGYGYVFRLLVEGYEDRSTRQGEAHGYCVRFAHPVGGSEAGHPLTYEEGGLILTQYVRDRPQTLSASRTRGATREANRRMFVSARSWVMPGRRPQKQR